MPGVHYICSECELSSIPSADYGLKKKVKLPPNITNSSQTIADMDDESDDDNLENQNIDTEVHNEDNSEIGGERNIDNQIPVQKREQICRYYAKGDCKFGRKGEGCPNSHPKPCRKLMKHGTQKSRGCTKGKKCSDWHPNMCLSSLRKGECYDDKCKFRHVKGTKRKKVEKSPLDNNDKGRNRISKSESSNVDFLDLIKLLKKELMDAMDQKVAAALSAQKTPTPQFPMYHQQLYYPQMPLYQNQNQIRPAFQIPACAPVISTANQATANQQRFTIPTY